MIGKSAAEQEELNKKILSTKNYYFVFWSFLENIFGNFYFTLSKSLHISPSLTHSTAATAGAVSKKKF